MFNTCPPGVELSLLHPRKGPDPAAVQQPSGRPHPLRRPAPRPFGSRRSERMHFAPGNSRSPGNKNHRAGGVYELNHPPTSTNKRSIIIKTLVVGF